jgi:long-chain acyl-CoA synthetase
MVISGGVNIYPAEIEAALLALPGVRDCAVFGIPHDEFGEALCAHIEPEPGAALDEAATRSSLREHRADFKVPRLIRFDTDLPGEDSGKIMKRKLRALLGSRGAPNLGERSRINRLHTVRANVIRK